MLILVKNLKIFRHIVLALLVLFLSSSNNMVKVKATTEEKGQTTQDVEETSGVLGTCPWTFHDGILKIGAGTIDGERLPDDWYFSNYQQLKEIDLAGSIMVQGSCYALFDGFPNLTTIQGLQYLDTDKVTNMYEMFANNPKLESLDLTAFDTSNVTNLTAMFANDAALQVLDLSSFDTKKVLSMKAMFAGDEGLKSLNLSSFDMRKNVGTLNMLATGDYPPQELTLGAHVILTSDMNLPDPEETDTYTGLWENVGKGNEENPIGQYIYDSFDLLTMFQGQKMADTFVWQQTSETETSSSSEIKKDTSQSKEASPSASSTPPSTSEEHSSSTISTTEQSSKQKISTTIQQGTSDFQIGKKEEKLLPKTGESGNALIFFGLIILNGLFGLLVFKNFENRRKWKK